MNTVLKFSNMAELASELAFAVRERVSGAQYGSSNVSCSTYVSLSRSEDECEARVRFSDHPNFVSGECHTIRFDRFAKAMYSVYLGDEGECAFFEEDEAKSDYSGYGPEYSHVEIHQSAFDRLVNEACEFLAS